MLKAYCPNVYTVLRGEVASSKWTKRRSDIQKFFSLQLYQLAEQTFKTTLFFLLLLQKFFVTQIKWKVHSYLVGRKTFTLIEFHHLWRLFNSFKIKVHNCTGRTTRNLRWHLLKTLVTDGIQKRRGEPGLFSFEENFTATCKNTAETKIGVTKI